MSELILRRLSKKDENAFIAALKQWDSDPSFSFVRDYKSGMIFSDYIDILSAYEQGKKLQPGHVPDTSLFGFLDNVIVGRLAIRHTLNDFLLKIGGHIGYGILPQFRRRGYAKQMLKLALPIAKDLGITRVLVTCNDNNIGSIKTIEANNGVLENKVSAGDDKPLKRRYWINI